MIKYLKMSAVVLLLSGIAATPVWSAEPMTVNIPIEDVVEVEKPAKTAPTVAEIKKAEQARIDAEVKKAEQAAAQAKIDAEVKKAEQAAAQAKIDADVKKAEQSFEPTIKVVEATPDIVKPTTSADAPAVLQKKSADSVGGENGTRPSPAVLKTKTVPPAEERSDNKVTETTVAEDKTVVKTVQSAPAISGRPSPAVIKGRN